ncbi:MAG: DUF1178 family protein [Kiloniellales bacterium]|nr:DUF1178 family protein [Kiloniellales bacterium]
MILYNLKCRKDHHFEVWFRDSEVYETQVAAGELRCPVCGSKKVAKALMAPRVARGGGQSDLEKAAKMRQGLVELRKQVEANCDYVGPSFAEEARKIHYGETEERNIYGETSADEAKALDDEGVKVQRIPWVPTDNS